MTGISPNSRDNQEYYSFSCTFYSATGTNAKHLVGEKEFNLSLSCNGPSRALKILTPQGTTDICGVIFGRGSEYFTFSLELNSNQACPRVVSFEALCRSDPDPRYYRSIHLAFDSSTLSTFKVSLGLTR